MTDTDLRSRELELEYRSFLDDEATDGLYMDKVKKMIQREETRLVVSINDVRKNPNYRERAKGLVENSIEELVAFQRALKEYVISLDPAYGRSKFEFQVGLCGSFGSRHVTPRTLTSRFLNNTVCVEGIVSKISLVKPKIVKSIFYCPATKKRMERRHYDFSSLEYQPNLNTLPGVPKDEDGNILELEYGDSLYKDHQTLTLQEMPECAPPGQLPRCVDVFLENDLVDSCKPGDRVQIVGSFRCLPNKHMNFSNCQFRAVILGNYVEQMSKEVSMLMTEEDVKACRKLSRTQKFDVFERMARSLAPSIHGHDYVKKALLCLLLGGVEKTLINGTRLRGDINVLLIGDPSVAKSQLLRFVLGLAPRAIATTGRGSSGVGLTAAVLTDPETGDRRLEAGAMVLADRGIVCVDEFDKMSDIDRTAIHEVMEQGRVTICKAGIQAKLNARCSVLAAANPVCGNYDPYRVPMENIGMQDSLLSRFDLLFIMLDEHIRDNDAKIAEHVLRVHKFRPANELEGEPLANANTSANFLSTMQDDKQAGKKTEMFEKHNPLLHGRNNKGRYFTMDFMKKYIHIAKLVKPQLTEEACSAINDTYMTLRTEDKKVDDLEKTQPITARTLETLIRLSTAHAKARLSTKVEQEDAEAAIDLIQHAIFHKVLVKPKTTTKRKRPAKENDEEGDLSEIEDDDEETRDSATSGSRKRTRTQRDQPDAEMDAEDTDKGPDVAMSEKAPSQPLTAEEVEELKKREPEFKKLLSDLSRQNQGASVLDVDLIVSSAQDQLGLSQHEIHALIKRIIESEDMILEDNSLYFV